MKLTFKMTGEEYYLGWKYKRKKGSLNSHALLISIIFAAVLIAISVLLKIDYYLYFFAGLIIVIGFLGVFTEKKAVIREYEYSPILSKEQTVRIFDDGIELINSYEKVFAPWQSVFAVMETPKYIKILPTFCKGIAVISKERYKSDELDNIIDAVRAHIKVEEGRN